MTVALASVIEEIRERGTPAQRRDALASVERFVAARAADPVGVALRPGAPLEARPPRKWQRVLVALATGGPKAWSTEGLEPSCPPRLVMAIAGNQSGKSTVSGLATAIHATGKSERFRSPGSIWIGGPRLADAVEIQRPYLSSWIGRGQAGPWLPHMDTSQESVLRTTAGWRVRSKAYEQGRKAWQGKPLQAVCLDEQPTDDGVVAECETRLVRHSGVLVVAMTPLHGTSSVLHVRAWEPWSRTRRRVVDVDPCPVCGVLETEQWAEVSPGVWVVTAGMRSNAVSRGGVILDATIDAKERGLIEMGRPLEARVSIHGEWLDTAEDRLIPAEMLRAWSEEPRAGFAEIVGWIDTASSTKKSADETAVAVWGRSYQGELYQLASEHGRWASHEKLDRICAVLRSHGCPNTWVDRQTGDMEFAAALNAELARRGMRPCVLVADTKTLDKVAVANLFAPVVAAGLVFIRPEHLEGAESFGQQARLFSGSYRGHDDTLDCGMKAALRLYNAVDGGHDQAAKAMDGAVIRRDDMHRDDDDGFDDWRMGDGLLGPD